MLKCFSYLALIATITQLFACCNTPNSEKGIDDSVLNRDYYTNNPATFVQFDPIERSEIYSRERYDVDLIPVVTSLIRPDYSGVDTFVDFKLFSYSGECLIFPGVWEDRFLNCSLFGSRISYKVLNDPGWWKGVLSSTPGSKDSSKYGGFCDLVESNFFSNEKNAHVLVTPMAYAFIMNHYYEDTRKLVCLTFSYDATVQDTSQQSLSSVGLFSTPKKKVTYTRRIICLADSTTEDIITFNYNSILTNLESYKSYIPGWGPKLPQ